MEVAVYTFLAYLIFSTVLEEIKPNFNVPMKESKIKSLKLFRIKPNYKKTKEVRTEQKIRKLKSAATGASVVANAESFGITDTNTIKDYAGSKTEVELIFYFNSRIFLAIKQNDYTRFFRNSLQL